MSVYKDGSKWRVIYRYTNSRGERKQTQKRGFSTKKEAQAWEREQMNKTESSLDMTFESFSEIYFEDMKKRLKDNTWHTKEHILRTKLIPFFGKRKMCDIQPKDVIAWQNEMLAYRNEENKPYSSSYLKTLQAILACVPENATQSAQCCVQLCSKVLRASEQSRSQGRQYGKSEEP